jgi:hypothetical protein
MTSVFLYAPEKLKVTLEKWMPVVCMQRIWIEIIDGTINLINKDTELKLKITQN